MGIDSLAPHDHINQLQLSKHMLKILAQLLKLPRCKLIISILDIELDRMFSLYHLGPISLLHIIVHDANNRLMPLDINRGLDKLLPLGGLPIPLWLHSDEEAHLGGETHVRHQLAIPLFEDFPRIGRHQEDVEVVQGGQIVQDFAQVGVVFFRV
jgi:hypothetical protein